MDILECPTTNEPCVKCYSAARAVGVEAVTASGIARGRRAEVIAQNALSLALIVCKADQPDWAVREGIVTCSERLLTIQKLVADIAVRPITPNEDL